MGMTDWLELQALLAQLVWRACKAQLAIQVAHPAQQVMMVLLALPVMLDQLAQLVQRVDKRDLLA